MAASDTTNILPLVVANPVELNVQWQDICSNPRDLGLWIVRMLAVDISRVGELNQFIVSDSEPVGADVGKPWIKTGSPPGIGVYDGERYYVIYPYPEATPFLWTKGIDALPAFLTKVNTGTLSDYGLTAPGNNDYFYAIFNPSA